MMSVRAPRGATPDGSSDSMLLCVVCGMDGRLFPADRSRMKSIPTVVQFLLHHGVILEERVPAWAVPHICEGCHKSVNRCDEFYFAFAGELSQLRKRTLTYDSRVADRLNVLHPVVEVKEEDEEILDEEGSNREAASCPLEDQIPPSEHNDPVIVNITEEEGSIVLQPETSPVQPSAASRQEGSSSEVDKNDSAVNGWTFCEVKLEASCSDAASIPETCQETAEDPLGGPPTSENDARGASSSGSGSGSERDEGHRDGPASAAGKRTTRKHRYCRNQKRVCAECGELVDFGKNSEHYRIAHPGVKLKNMLLAEFLKCRYCDYQTQRESNLLHHEKQKHNVARDSGTAKILKCPHCPVDKFFKSKDSLESHLNTAHGKPKSVPCPQCNKLFITSYRMKMHLQSVHATGTATKVCEHCGEQVLAHRYKNHISNRHRGKSGKVFTCEICGDTRAANKGLKIHMKRDHGVGDYELPEVQKFQCPKCDKPITKREYYFRHLYKMHGIEEPGLAAYKRACEQCGEILVGRAEYDGHVKIHSGDRYVCPTCGYKTRFLGNFTKHRKTMHGYVPVDPKHCRNTSAPGFQQAAAPFLKTAEEIMQTE